jgi:3-phosphoshikimate 1-carboxyvinyltransferase
MIAGLSSLGATINVEAANWRIQPIEDWPAQVAIDCGLAGTVMRFLPPLAAIGATTAQFSGDPAAMVRPMAPLLGALADLGAQVEGRTLPFRIRGPINGKTVGIDASTSSQFVSGLLLAAPRFPYGLKLTHRGETLPSTPHITMTIAALQSRGAAVRVGANGTSWEVAPSQIEALDDQIEPDLTTAAVFLGAALVSGGAVTVPGWPTVTDQPGQQILEILEAMGARVTLDASGLRIEGDGAIRGLDVDLRAASELTPVVAGLAALAETETRIRGVGHIRGHETDRLQALQAEITALGGQCEELSDGLVIRPAALHSGVFHTYGDHRLAHTGALIGLRVPGVRLDDITVTTKTMPEFPLTWEGMVQ